MTDEDKAYMAEVLEWALRYAAMGFEVFPGHSIYADGSCTCDNPACENIGKHPRTAKGFKDASKDKAQIEKRFGPKAPLSNVLIRTGEVSGITVLDIDTGPKKMGVQTWMELIRDHGEPRTLHATTGSGGIHLLFQYNSALKTSSNTLGKHVDCRNDNGYIVAAPSRHKSGGRYSWDNWGILLAPLPAHFIPNQKENKTSSDRPLEPEITLDEAEDMLSVIPPDDRDTWRAIGIILGRYFNLSDEAWTVYVTWADKWGGRKGDGHDERMHECFYTLSQESAHKTLSIGTIIKLARDHGWVSKAVLEMNRQYGVVWMGGDCVILREHRAPDTGHLEVSFCSKTALKLFHAADPKIGRTNKVEAWLRHPEHRTYDGIVFQPGRASCDPSLYNLWQGFAVEPKQGDCSLYWTHLKDNICAGDDELYGYVRAWMANVVQTPGNRPGWPLFCAASKAQAKVSLQRALGDSLRPILPTSRIASNSSVGSMRYSKRLWWYFPMKRFGPVTNKRKGH